MEKPVIQPHAKDLFKRKKRKLVDIDPPVAAPLDGSAAPPKLEEDRSVEAAPPVGVRPDEPPPIRRRG